ncbi:MAG: hypothetical protein PHE83_09190 [Opitutaceae bacterium]|nr:hypothetical protein [Opitutaceae bacterium]
MKRQPLALAGLTNAGNQGTLVTMPCNGQPGAAMPVPPAPTATAQPAWSYYLYTGDKAFLEQALEATANTLARREQEEFDATLGLFRGPAVYGDGIAAYPDRYVTPNGSSGIYEWPPCNPEKKAPVGYGLPMHTLSLNCTYFHTYEVISRMAAELNRPIDPAWAAKAARLQEAINRHFWKPDLGRYITLVDPWGTDERQEAIGMAFSVLFGLADRNQQDSLFRHSMTTPAGMPVLWPTYSRYLARGGFGRHSGTIWPHAQAFWADAAARTGHVDLVSIELTGMAEKAVRDGQFYEIYNPMSGQPDGGLQEGGGRGIVTWESCPHQTWSATGYLRLIFFDLIGMRFDEAGVCFEPTLPGGFDSIALTGLPYRQATLDIHISGSGSRIKTMKVNGSYADHRLPADASGRQEIQIELTR